MWIQSLLDCTLQSEQDRVLRDQKRLARLIKPSDKRSCLVLSETRREVEYNLLGGNAYLREVWADI